jgi:hypothetical protein
MEILTVKTGNLVFQHSLSGYRPRFNEQLAISNGKMLGDNPCLKQ